MKLKLILVMAMTLISVFGAIYISTIYAGFAAGREADGSILTAA